MTALLRVLLLSASLAAGTDADFDHQEPITLDLKDASITDVITLLGALANLPVSIAPDVTGRTSIQVNDVPYDRVLELVGKKSGIWLRVEGGKLVATRRSPSAESTAAPAPTLEREIGGARLPVEDYSRAFPGGRPIFWRAGGAAGSCARLTFQDGPTYELPVPGAGAPAYVAQFGWDPVSRTRFLAVEFPGAPPRVLALTEPPQGSPEPLRGDGPGWSLSSRAKPDERCADFSAWRPVSRSGGVIVRMRVVERRGEQTETLLAPQVNALPGTVFSLRGGVPEDVGQHREIIVYGYVSADAKAFIGVLVATALWKDPRDGREYVYSEVPASPDVRFLQPSGEAAVASTLPAGAALEHPVELLVWTPLK